MIKFNITNRLFWTIMIFGLFLMGACSNNGPTAPNPSDVKDYAYGPGGFPVADPSIATLIQKYDALAALGGGAQTFKPLGAYALIGAFDRWSGNPLNNVVLTVQSAGGEPTQYILNDMILLQGLTYPISVSVICPQYTGQRILNSNANILAFGLEANSTQGSDSYIIGYIYDYNYLNHWMVKGSSTQFLRANWATSNGDSFNPPNIMFRVNPNRPVGGAAFIYNIETLTMPTDGDQVSLPYQLVGYSYKHVGMLAPGAVGGWVMDITESGSGTGYNNGNFTVAYDPSPGYNPLNENIGTLEITPGGYLENTVEFIPYYPPTTTPITSSDGVYQLSSFAPPAVADRDAVLVRAKYANHASETALVDWDPSGASAPTINLSMFPKITEVKLTSKFGMPSLQLSWENEASDGVIMVELFYNLGNNTVHEVILLDSIATGLAEGGIPVPALKLGQSYTIRVTRFESSDIDLDNFNNQSLWGGFTSMATSSPVTLNGLPSVDDFESK